MATAKQPLIEQLLISLSFKLGCRENKNEPKNKNYTRDKEQEKSPAMVQNETKHTHGTTKKTTGELQASTYLQWLIEPPEGVSNCQNGSCLFLQSKDHLDCSTNKRIQSIHKKVPHQERHRHHLVQI